MFSGDLGHGHSHGGENKKVKNKKDTKKNEDSIEVGEVENLCADDHNDAEHHGHSHGVKSSTSENNPIENGGEKDVKKRKRKTSKKNIEE